MRFLLCRFIRFIFKDHLKKLFGHLNFDPNSCFILEGTYVCIANMEVYDFIYDFFREIFMYINVMR